MIFKNLSLTQVSDITALGEWRSMTELSSLTIFLGY